MQIEDFLSGYKQNGVRKKRAQDTLTEEPIGKFCGCLIKNMAQLTGFKDLKIQVYWIKVLLQPVLI
ncbi:MAG: hypothetical protein ACK4KT_05745 [Thermaurantimonas sp.]